MEYRLYQDHNIQYSLLENKIFNNEELNGDNGPDDNLGLKPYEGLAVLSPATLIS